MRSVCRLLLATNRSCLASQIYLTPLAATRNFPITFTESGDIAYPEFAYPNRGWIISPALSGVLSTLVPIAVVALAQVRIRSFWDANNAIMGLLYAVILGTLFQVVLKQLVGGFRPFFLDVCQPDLDRIAAGQNATGLNGVGFHSVMYTVDVCTNTNEMELKNAMTSFPSGHSTAAFAGYGFLFLWMNAKLKVWADFRAGLGWLALLFAPVLGATLIACSLSINQAHNWYDILAGTVIGIVMAFASYRVMYAAVWDWRYNHIPLRRAEVFKYVHDIGPDHTDRHVFVRRLGWGRRQRGVARSSRGPGSARSSATYGRGGSGPSPDGRAVRYPDTTRTRDTQANGRPTADNMV